MSKKFYTYFKKYGNKIFHRGYDENGLKFTEEVRFKPSFFIKSNNKNSTWKSIRDVPMQKLDFDDIKSAEEFFKKYEDVAGFEVQGNRNYGIQFSHSEYSNLINYNRHLIKIGYIDIETHSDIIKGFPEVNRAEHEIVTCTFVTSDERIICLTRKPFDISNLDESISNGYQIEHHCISNERKFLLKIIEIFRREDFDIISGWNSNGFDIPYIYKRIEKICGKEYTNLLSKLNIVFYRTYFDDGKEINECTIYGTQTLDFFDVFQKFGYAIEKLENYKLDTVALHILGEQKLDYEEYGSLREFYNQNPQKHTEYNIKDAMLVKRLNDKLGFFNTVLALAYKAKTNYEETLGTVEIWDSIIYGYLLAKNICVPKHEFKSKREFAGGAVKDVQAGLWDWLVAIDAGSLYPNTLYQFNISPETISGIDTHCVVDDLLSDKFPEFDDKKYILTASGLLFNKKEIGFIPKLIKELLNERGVVKGDMIQFEKELNQLKAIKEKDHDKISEVNDKIVKLEGLQLAIKILMNSLYGALGSNYFRYFDVRLAESVTLTGQAIIKYTINKINSLLQKDNNDSIDRGIMSDTDSFYFSMSYVVKDSIGDDKEKSRIIDRFFKENIEPYLEKELKAFGNKFGCVEHTVKMKREGIASKTLVVAKKRYAQLVINSEGVEYAEPKLKIIGINAVRSDTPNYIRKLFSETLKTILSKDELSVQSLIKDRHEEFKRLPYDQIAKPTGVNGLTDYYDSINVFKKGAPRHVKGALIYNKLLKDKNLIDKYELIYSKDKIKTLNLLMPNTIGYDIIGFKGELPEEFGLQKYIDYDNMWHVTYMKPMTDLLNICGWQPVKKLNMFNILDNL